MKLKNKILMLAPAITFAAVTPITTLVSCGNKETDLTIDTTKDDHVLSITYDGELKTNKVFKIICTFQIGWGKISKSKSTITVGNKLLVEGSDKDYEVTSDNTITVHKNVIKEKNVIVHIEADPTPKTIEYSIEKGSSQVVVDGRFIYAKPGDKITKDNIKVKAVKGDGSKEEIALGTANGQYKIFKDGADVTEYFAANGYTFTDADAQGGPNQINLEVQYTYGNSSFGETLWVFCGKPTTTITISDITDLTVGGPSKEIKYTVGANEYRNVSFKITGGTADDAKIDDSGVGVYLKPGTKSGTVVVTATALVGGKTAEHTFTIA